MRTPEESKEVSKAYNLDLEIIKKYVQYGSGKHAFAPAGCQSDS